ncbi:MAG: DUF669 domain-containing protein [Planctomycetaceae bacterium]
MADLRGFNAHTVEPSESFDPIPAGEYLCVITNSEDKPTKAGTGSYLELEFEVLDGPFKGRKLWDRLNLANPNELAVKIARATLSAICRAVGVMEPKDSCELHDLPLLVKVRVEKRPDTDEPANVIKGYRSKHAAPTVAAPMATSPVAGAPRSGAQAQAGSAGPPWRRT